MKVMRDRYIIDKVTGVDNCQDKNKSLNHNIPVLRIDRCLTCSSSKRLSCKIDVWSIDFLGQKFSSNEVFNDTDTSSGITDVSFTR